MEVLVLETIEMWWWWWRVGQAEHDKSEREIIKKNEMMAQRKFSPGDCITVKSDRPCHGFGSHLDE